MEDDSRKSTDVKTGDKQPLCEMKQTLKDNQRMLSESLTEKLDTLQNNTDILKREIDEVKDFWITSLKTDFQMKTDFISEKLKGLETKTDLSDEEGSLGDETMEAADIKICNVSLDSKHCDNYRSNIVKSLIVKINSIKFTKCYSFKVSCTCPIFVVEGTRVWVTYHVEKTGVIELYNLKGVKSKVEIEVTDTVQRMTGDGHGLLYVTCRDEQCVKAVDTVSREVDLLFTTEGFPNGICYRSSTESFLLSETEGPSYFVYEGEHYNKLYNVAVPYKNSDSKEELECNGTMGFAQCAAYNRNGDRCVADYIDDKVFIFSPTGQLKVTYDGEEDDVFNPIMLCCDNDGLILTLCTATKAVYILNENGQFLSKLKLDGFPNCIAVNNKGMMWIGFQFKDEIEVYKYTKEM